MQITQQEIVKIIKNFFDEILKFDNVYLNFILSEVQYVKEDLKIL